MSNTSPKTPTTFTIEANKKMAAAMQSFDMSANSDVNKGFIAPLPNGGLIEDGGPAPVLNLPAFAFLDDEANNASINPSLRRHSQLMRVNGLFKVTDRLYQVRGIGSSITIVEGDSGIIVIDTGMSLGAATTARDLYFEHRGKKEVKALIITHPHGDHNGGVTAFVSPEDAKSGKVKIYGPEGYAFEAISESIFAGTPMRRRAGYMFGQFLPISPTGNAGIGIGIYNARGKRQALLPTTFITHTGQVVNIDGLDFEFQLAKDVEAPVELNFYIRQLKAATTSENCEQLMHNTYTLRGAKIRNPLVWSKMLQEVIDMWADKTEVLFTSHSWPVWGKENIIKHLSIGRDGYRYINDQTLHLASLGYTPDEIGDMIRFPAKLDSYWSMRGHYGTLSHNAKGTFNYYLGYFDGNPSTLNPLPPEQSAPRYLECMGGAGAVFEKAQAAFNTGEYRWAAELLNKIVFAEPANTAAKELLADSYEQMGYQAEAAPWRNTYLTGAMELRAGVNRRPLPPEGVEDGLSIDLLLDYLSIRIDSFKAGDLAYTFNITLTGEDNAKATLYLSNGVISHTLNSHANNADAEINMPLSLLSKVIFGSLTLEQACAENGNVTGNIAAVEEMLSHRAQFDPWYNIVTP
ncbi:MBL fold metallo-hydrolase [Desulfovibrio sp. OttesenSCG-928-F07]|nr:MBL fold metallo-hydrolase [Desulfovibrio sp. OttesenSCG-928-F07]